jgi:hypothetical protein
MSAREVRRDQAGHARGAFEQQIHFISVHIAPFVLTAKIRGGAMKWKLYK